MGKNVAVFVDVANIFYAAKAAGVDIDYVLLLKAATAGRDLVRAYAYTGLDPDNENQRNFHSFLARNNFKVVSKDIRKYGDGKVKANLDIELVVDLMKTSRNLDVAVVVSGDGDFAPAIRAVQETGVRVEVISFRGNTSSDLMEVADKFTDITQLAKVEKGSTVSGRRVASDDEDLSMTEVPDKESEGTGRGRGRGRGRARPERVEEVAAEPTTTSRGRSRVRRPAAEPAAEPAPVAGGAATAGGALVALPGEKLSKAAAARIAASETAVVEEEDEELVTVEAEVPGEGETTEEGDERRRRRRRRGGRGRGRGRGQDEAVAEGSPEHAAGEVIVVDDVARGGRGGRRTASPRARRHVRLPSGRSGIRRSACPRRRGPCRPWTTRSSTTSLRSPNTCWPSVVAARRPQGASVAASAAASAAAAARTPRPWTASGTAVVAAVSRRSRAAVSRAAGQAAASEAARAAGSGPRVPRSRPRSATGRRSDAPRRSRGARSRRSSRSS